MANFRWNFVTIFSLGKIQKFWIGKFPIESGKKFDDTRIRLHAITTT